MSMRHNEHIAILTTRLIGRPPNNMFMIFLSNFGDEIVDSRHDVGGGFTVGTAVAPYVPGLLEALGGALGADFGGCYAFVGAVVPFADAGGYGYGGCGVAGAFLEG